MRKPKHNNHPEFEFLDPECDGGAIKSPGEYIKQELEARGWSQADLAKITGRPLPTINEIIGAKRAIMPEMAVALGIAFGSGAALWVHREAAYRLSLVQTKDSNTERFAKLYAIAPIKEMQRRNWINNADSADEIEQSLKEFFGKQSLDDIAQINAAARQTNGGEPLSTHQQAWLNQSRRLAGVLNVRKFNPSTFEQSLIELRKFAKNREGAKNVPRFLAEIGVRLVINEGLSKARIDGAAFWLDSESPVVVLSMRFDRIDCFWHTLMHELRHIANNDVESLDSDLIGEHRERAVMDFEMRADSEGAELLIPQKQLESFITRNAPIFTKERINQFAHRMEIHPGIIVGQLQHKGAISYKQFREALVKVRELVTTTAITDGHDAPSIQFN